MYIFRTAVGIRGKDGVVFGVEKLVTSKLYEAGANKRLFNIDRHIGIVSRYTLLLMSYSVIMWHLVAFIITNRTNNLKEKIRNALYEKFQRINVYVILPKN